MEVCVCFGGEERCPAERGGGGTLLSQLRQQGKKGKTRYLYLNYYKQFIQLQNILQVLS